MSVSAFFMLYLFVVFLMILTFSIGIVLGTELPDRFRKQVKSRQVQKIHGEAMKRVDDVVDYYVGLQEFIMNRLDDLKTGPRRSSPRSGAHNEGEGIAPQNGPAGK